MERSASSLADAGFDVVVVTPRFVSKWLDSDRALVSAARWRHEAVDFLQDGNARRRWQWARLRMHACRRAAVQIP